MTRLRPACGILFALLVLSLPVAAWAKQNPSYTQVGRSIYIGPDQQVSDLTCFGCSIRIRGQAAGDVTTFGGSVTIEDLGQVAGDVTAFGGNVRVDKATKVAGDVAVFGGDLHRAPEAQIAGDVTAYSGRGWMLLFLLVPFLLLGLLIALVVWVVRRVRHPVAPVPA